jgi:hypothetical protein
MKVTMHFTIEELYASDTAKRLGINNKPDIQHVINLVYLAAYILEPLRVAMNEPIKIGSGFRSQSLNKAVGGVYNSQHMKGQAADIRTVENTTMANKRLFDVAMKSGLPFDQLIDEYGYNWIHISFNTKGNRKQVLHLK